MAGGVRGFTLVELVVVLVIVGVLAAIAVPRFIALGRDARLAAVRTMAATLTSTSLNLRALCKTHPACDYNAVGQYLTIAGRPVVMHYGWIDSGDNLGINEIDAWVQYTGFTASLPDLSTTLFTLDGAPDPATCSAAYLDPFVSPDHNARVVVTTTGC